MNAPLSSALLRKEDQRLITGSGQFSADAHPVGLLYGHVIRSPHAHARITHMDFSAVRSAPGVHLVLTAQDVLAAGFADLPNAVQVKDPQGQPQAVCTMPVLAHDKVLYVGQPVAWVVADTALQAQDAAELAQIDYDTLDAVVTYADAKHPATPRSNSKPVTAQLWTRLLPKRTMSATLMWTASDWSARPWSPARCGPGTMKPRA